VDAPSGVSGVSAHTYTHVCACCESERRRRRRRRRRKVFFFEELE